MLLNNKLTFLIITLGIGHALHGNGVCKGNTYKLLNETAKAQLVDVVEQEGREAFLIKDIYKPLDLTRKKSDLEDGFKKWKNFKICFNAWFENNYSNFYKTFYYSSYYAQQLKSSDEAFELIKKVYLALQERPNLEDIKKRLNTNINSVAETLYTNYRFLEAPSIPDKTPEAVVNDYEKSTGIMFNPNAFLIIYKKAKQKIEKSTKKITPEEVFAILSVGFPGIPKAIKITSKNEPDIQISIEEFINTIEQLIYQSERINKARKFWQTKPKYLLSSSQIFDMKEVVAKLYALYPAIITETLKKRLDGSHKLYIVLYAQARMIMIVLRSYLRTINSLLAK